MGIIEIKLYRINDNEWFLKDKLHGIRGKAVTLFLLLNQKAQGVNFNRTEGK